MLILDPENDEPLPDYLHQVTSRHPLRDINMHGAPGQHMALLLGSTWHKWHPCAGKATQTAFGSAPPLAHNVFLCGVQSLSRGSTPPTQPFIRLARRHATVWHVTEKRTIDSDCSRAIALLVLYVFCPPRCCDLPAIAPLVLSFARHGAAICPPSLFWCCLLPAPVLRFARHRSSGAVFCPPRCCYLPAIALLVLSFARPGATICPLSLLWCGETPCRFIVPPFPSS